MSRISQLAAVALVAAAASRSQAQEAATLRWPVRYESVGTVVRAEGEQRFATRIEGELTATTVEERGDSTIVAYRVDRPTVSFTVDDRAVPEDRRIAAAIERYVFAHRDAEGRVAAVRFDPAAGPFERGVIRSLLASLQFVVPRAGPPASWESEEDEPNGRYLAEYAVVDTVREVDGPRLQIAKRKVRYLPAGADAPFDILPDMMVEGTSRVTGVYDLPRRRLVTLEGHETQTMAMGARALGRSETVVSLGRVTSGTAEDPAAIATALMRSGPPVSLVSTGPDVATREAQARLTIGQRTIGAALAELARADTAGARPPVDRALSALLRSFAVADPAAIDTLAVALAAAPAGSLTMHTIGSALAAAGAERAHAGLALALRRRTGDPAAASLLLALLGSAIEPTRAAEEALREVAFGAADSESDGLEYAARLALGTLARRVARESPERAARIVQDLIASYGPRSEGETARRLLLVLGNTGSPATLEPARQALDDPSPALREAAVGALRFVRDPVAESVILATLADDPSPSVRLGALDALSFRPTTEASFAACFRAAREDADAAVRLAAIQSLWGDRDRYPKVGELVDQAAEHDPAPEVRRRARWLLGRGE